MQIEIVILPSARRDLENGFSFYEMQEYGLGSYFLESLFSDIESLRLYAGIHHEVSGRFRLLSKRFPYAIYYQFADRVVKVDAVLDCRSDPPQIYARLRKQNKK